MIHEQAEQYARLYHQGQYRKGGLPFIVHPQNVVSSLISFGFDNEHSLAIGWLHDTLEDTPLSYEEIYNVFGEVVAQGVYILTRNVDRETYKKRLTSAPDTIKAIKLCDTLDNIASLPCLSREGIETKINDCLDFYIPMAQGVCPPIAAKMKKIIDSYTHLTEKIAPGGFSTNCKVKLLPHQVNMSEIAFRTPWAHLKCKAFLMCSGYFAS